MVRRYFVLVLVCLCLFLLKSMTIAQVHEFFETEKMPDQFSAFVLRNLKKSRMNN